MLNGPHTRVRVDAAVMPSAPPMVSPQAKGRKKAAPLRQMGLGNFYKGETAALSLAAQHCEETWKCLLCQAVSSSMIPEICGLATSIPHSELHHVSPCTGAVVT